MTKCLQAWRGGCAGRCLPRLRLSTAVRTDSCPWLCSHAAASPCWPPLVGHCLLQMDLYPEVPDNVPLYNLREVVPEIYEPR